MEAIFTSAQGWVVGREIPSWRRWASGYRSLPISVVRTGIEGVALLVGWILGSKVGLGTAVSVFGIGFILQGVFSLLKFDVTTAGNESLITTGKVILQALQKRAVVPKTTDAQAYLEEDA